MRIFAKAVTWVIIVVSVWLEHVLETELNLMGNSTFDMVMTAIAVLACFGAADLIDRMMSRRKAATK
jgi:hypothetical protein